MMAPPTWAYQVDNFYPAPHEELVCSICQAVFCDPVQSPCNHVFCRNCIEKWLESNRNCPICRKRTTQSSLQEVVPLVKNIIMKLNIRCHNHVRGCREQFPLESCESHIKDCACELVQCRNQPCKMMFMKGDMLVHEMLGCAYRYVRCRTCKLKISSREPNCHDCIKDLRKKLKEKTIKLKMSNQKIKKLESEFKASIENDYSETSSFESSSAFDSYMLFGHIDSEVSSISSVDSSSYVSDSDENPFWINASGDLIYDSIEFSHSSSPVNVGGFNVIQVDESPSVMEIEDVEPQVRRPAKRRFNSLVPYSTDEEEDSIDDPLPFCNRTLQRNSDDSPSYVTTFEESSIRCLDSDSSYADAAEAKTEDLLYS